MKTKILSIVLSLALTLSLGLLSKVGCDRAKLQSANDQLNEQLMQADLDLGRAWTQFGNASDYISQLEDDIQDDINERDAVVTMYGRLQANYKRLEKKQGRHIKTVYHNRLIEVPAKLKLDPGMVYVAQNATVLRPVTSTAGKYEDFRLKISATMMPYPDRIDWSFSYDLHMRLEVQMAESYTESGAINHYATVWELDDTGKRVQKLDIVDFSVVVNRPNQSQWFWWAPHLDIGGLIGGTFTPPDLMLGGSIGISPFGYGLTVNDLEWRFLRVSLDLSSNLPGVGITPVVYNIGRLIPLLSNLWIGPHASWVPPERWGLSLFIGGVL